jgi:hypothetical protein
MRFITSVLCHAIDKKEPRTATEAIEPIRKRNRGFLWVFHTGNSVGINQNPDM